MEPEVRLFLRTIVQTVSCTILWMMLVTWFGIKEGLLFFDGGVTLWAIVFYILMIGSFIYLLRYLLRLWLKVPKFGREEY